jgi:dTDP-glucose 4,6-dehydratase
VHDPRLRADLDEVSRDQGALWQSLAGARIFITGATGFFGKWLMALLEHARAEHGLDVELTILSRSGLERPGLRVLQGDVRTFTFPKDASFTHVIHGATASSATPGSVSDLEMFDTVLDGTRRVMQLAAESGAKRVLYVSSGSVYGPQPADVTHLTEEHSGGFPTTDPRHAYHESKRAAELLSVMLAQKHRFEVSIARGFAFCAPYLPLDIHFAIGNFLRDALAKNPIRIFGDGTPYRSDMYGSDLALWLLAILARGRSGAAYNVGSDDGRPLSVIAQEVGRQANVAVEIAKPPTPGAAPSRYVPSIARAKSELGLELKVSLEEAVRRTIAFHRG